MIPTPIRRRTVLAGISGLIAAGCGSGSGGTALSSQPNPGDSPPATAESSLRTHAAAKGLLYGTSAGSNVSSNAAFAAQVAQECSLLVPENALKWKALRPTPETFDFAAADQLAEFARANNMRFRGHTLVWHQALPSWFGSVATRQNAEQLMTDHIMTVMGHYAGQMHSWDVVNEAINLSNDRPDNLRNSPWLGLLGPDYLDIAFRAAAQADPQALLVYNEVALDLPGDEAKRTAVLRLLERLISQGSPVQALGMQAHLRADAADYNANQLQTFLQQVADLGLKILITEMDVSDRYLPADIQRRDQEVAQVYGDYLSILLEQTAVIAVITWGLSDRYTWLKTEAPRADGLPVRVLPLDDQLQRKPAWTAMARAFDQAPSR